MAFGKGKNQMKSVENAPKIKKDKIRNATKANRNRGILITIVFALILCSIAIAIHYTNEGKMVEVVTLKSSVPQDGIITEDNLLMKQMSANDYLTFGSYNTSDNKVRTTIILWEDRSKVFNTYASYYIKAGTPLYWDAVGNETPKQFSYLYSMDGELLKISIDAKTFGQMLVPGDHINVRAAYTETVTTLPTYDEFYLQQQMGLTNQTQVDRQIMLFNNVAILDMLNGQGESIFDLYYELLALPKDKQTEMINSADFVNRVEPSEILLNVTPEEADRYMSIQSNGPTYMMTLLPRTSSNAITELLNELQTGFARAS